MRQQDPSARLRVAIAQLNLMVGDIGGNARQVVDAATRARDALDAHLVVFPELTLTGYPPDDLLLRAGLYQRVEQALERVCEQVRGVDVVVGYPERAGEVVYNAAAVIRDGQVIATYRKHHLPNYSVFDEKRYFVSGDQPCVIECRGVPVGITICEDVWAPGPVHRAVEHGARLLVNLNASPFHQGKWAEREAELRKRLGEGAVPMVYVNLVGGQDELVFDGGSFVIDASGELTHRAPAFETGLFPVDFEADGSIVPCPGDVVAPLDDEASLYRALVSGVRDYFHKNGFNGAVIGLSGGIDSALTLAIAVDAIGPEQIEVVLMPSRYTAQMSIDDAVAMADGLGVQHTTISIEPAFDAFLQMLDDEFAGYAADTTEENIQARCRGIVLMAISNKKRRILLSTGNKSEMAVGYATLYGDMAGGFAPIKDVLKTMVYRLARYRNRLGSVIPERILERAPSAELAEDQKDTDALPAYSTLDPILERYVEQDYSPQQLVDEGYDPETVARIIHMVDRAEYKRRQAPPGVRITRRAFGRDRRYPITSGYGRPDAETE